MEKRYILQTFSVLVVIAIIIGLIIYFTKRSGKNKSEYISNIGQMHVTATKTAKLSLISEDSTGVYKCILDNSAENIRTGTNNVLVFTHNNHKYIILIKIGNATDNFFNFRIMYRHRTDQAIINNVPAIYISPEPEGKDVHRFVNKFTELFTTQSLYVNINDVKVFYT